MVYFWACEVSENKAAAVKVPEGFVLNVCNATLASFSNDAASVSLGLETSQMDSKAWKGVVAHLGAAAHAHQVKLDLVFGITTQIKFYIAKGTGKVNLTGYFQPGPPADLFEGAEVETTTATQQSSSKRNNKKRAREEPVTWDQVEPSDSDAEEEAKPKSKPAAAAPAKPSPVTPQHAKSKPAAAPVANGSSNVGASEGSSKKKKRNKNKKPNADKKD